MVETDVGDDTEVGTDDVGTVEASSQADFDDCYIYLLLSEIIECHGGGELEERGVQRFEECTVILYVIDDISLSYGDAVHADALAEIDEVWRGVESYLVSGRLEDGGQGM